MQACRDVLRNFSFDSAVLNGCHPGILLSSYLQLIDKDGEERTPEITEARVNLLKAVISAGKSQSLLSLYRTSFNRRSSCVQVTANTNEFKLTTTGRLIVGLGESNSLETGITLHTTYGTPYIPGAAIKGLASHYCHTMWGNTNPAFKAETGKHHQTIFGTAKSAGHIIFEDAWITPDSLNNGGIVLDVMTPHHQEYYGAGENDNLHPPTDHDRVIPIPFLSVTGGFHFVLSSDSQGDDIQQWIDFTKDIITYALQDWGIGAKTRIGYGRMM